MPSKKQNDPIRLLHLSDFHFRADKAWDADPVLRALARFIANEVAGDRCRRIVADVGGRQRSGSTMPS